MRKRHLFIWCAFTFCIAAVKPSVSAYASQNLTSETYSAEITWSTDKPSTSQVEYGEDIQSGYSNITGIDSSLVTSHKVILSNLKPSAPYHYRVRSRDVSGQEIVSKDFTLMIYGPESKAPLQITDVQAANVIAAGVSLPLSASQPLEEKIARLPADDRKVMIAKAFLEKEAPSEAAPAEKPASGSMIAKEESIEKTLIQKGGLLLPKNTLQLEPSFTYAHISVNKIAIQGFAILPILVLGEISADKVKRDIFISAASLRYGLLDNLQWNIKVPYKFQYERISNTASQESTRSNSGIGDIETGLFYQFLYEQGPRPGLIGGITVKSNTGQSPYGRAIGIGTGHWAVKPSLVWVKSTDPAILFGSVGATWNVERDISGFGSVDPGDSFEYSLGLAFALNYQTALNFQIEHLITDKTRISNNPVPASFVNAMSFKTGLTYSFNKNLSLDVVTSYGLSEDAPDFVLELRLPYTF